MRVRLGQDDKIIEEEALRKCYEKMKRYREKRLTMEIAREYRELGLGLNQSEEGNR